MKQKLKRFMAGFMAMLTMVGTLFTNGTTAFAASPQANIAFWNASVKNSGEVSELKPGYNHGKILYSILDGNSAYCMNFGLRADGGQLMNSYDDASTSMSAQQRKLLSYCLYYGFNSTQKAAPSNSQCDEYIATQAMVWVIVADIFGTGSGDSAARKLCNTAPSPDSSYSYYERLRDNISSSYNATLPSFASRRTSEAPTYELKWNEGSQRFETTLSDSNGVLSDFDFGISGYSVDKNGNSITISSTSVNTTATRDKELIDNPEFAITIGKVTYTERVDGGTMMLEAISKCKTGETTVIGKFHGFELLVEKNFLGINYMVLRGKTEYKAELSTSPVGSMVKLENLFNGLHENIDFFEKKIEQYQNDLEASKAEYDKPFAYSKELEEKLARQCKLNAQLDLENAKAVDADLSGPEEEREADDRMESAAIVAEDKGAYPADREGRTR